jgi:hypothetical protein
MRAVRNSFCPETGELADDASRAVGDDRFRGRAPDGSANDIDRAGLD